MAGKSIFLCFYQSFYEAINEIPSDTDKWRMMTALYEYRFYGVIPDFEYPLSSIWRSIMPNVESSMRNYDNCVENGKKGGAPKGNQNARKHFPNNQEDNQENNHKKEIENDTDTEMDIAMDTTMDIAMDNDSDSKNESAVPCPVDKGTLHDILSGRTKT